MVMVAKPAVPQTRIRFRGQRTVTVKPSAGATVALMLTHDWGPMGVEAGSDPLTEFSVWTDTYGDSDTEGRTAVAEAFAGHNLPSAGGAGGVIPYRMGTGATRASVTLKNTANVDAVRFDAQWNGVRGNQFSVLIDTDPADATRARARIRFNGATIGSTISYPKASLATLVAAINVVASSYGVSAALLADGTALTVTAGSALQGGTNGGAITSADYIAALQGLEFLPFTLLAAANLTDSAVQASILSWVRSQEAANRPIVWVVGGLAGESLSDALARTVALADPHVVNFGVGTYLDDLLGKQLSTAQLAPRIAGILAARGEERALTAAELGGLHVVGTTGVSSDDASIAVSRGVTVLIRTDSPDADLRVAKGVTTFTSTSDPDRPLEIFSEPRFIRIMDLFIRGMKQWGDRIIIGNVPVNQDTRDAVKQEGTKRVEDFIRRGLVLTKAAGATDDPYFDVPVTTDDTVPFSFGWQFARTANYLLGEGRVR